eukprot:6184030-Prymnesium_polylepis.1
MIGDGSPRPRKTRCVIGHEHRRGQGRAYTSTPAAPSGGAAQRSAMRAIQSVLRHASSANALQRWDRNDVPLQRFVEAAKRHGLVVAPLLTQRGAPEGARDPYGAWDGPGDRDDDISIIEVSLADAPAN